MKTVTIILEEKVAQWARAKAAGQGLNVSRYLGELLQERMAEEGAAYEEAMRRYLERQPTQNLNDGTPYPRREELYDRPLLR